MVDEKKVEAAEMLLVHVTCMSPDAAASVPCRFWLACMHCLVVEEFVRCLRKHVKGGRFCFPLRFGAVNDNAF